MNLALFDLDHTLLPIDSDHTWGAFCIAEGLVDPAEHQRRNDEFAAQYRAGTLDIHAYVAFAMRVAAAAGKDRAAQLHHKYMSDWILPAMQPEALDLVRSHQAAGDTCIIITATNEFVTRDIATAFGVEHLIAVDLERDADGHVTNRIAGVPSFKDGKVMRMGMWLSERGLAWSDVPKSTFYSDSMNDLPLLERVTHPVATNPDERLRALAVQRQWRILDLFQT
ncbi:MAG: HAD-IB family hydrolase [Cytophagales bacterium]|nr:HAD-IB family hydrolase [Cytophagales bacterium]